MFPGGGAGTGYTPNSRPLRGAWGENKCLPLIMSHPYNVVIFAGEQRPLDHLVPNRNIPKSSARKHLFGRAGEWLAAGSWQHIHTYPHTSRLLSIYPVMALQLACFLANAFPANPPPPNGALCRSIHPFRDELWPVIFLSHYMYM